jgi:regulator of replication initiation timing
MREENEVLRMENQKIKKMMKYTRINEIEIEKKVVIEENKRMSAILEEYSNQLVNQEEVEKEN